MSYEAAIANLIRTASNPSTPANVLAELSSHRDSRVRRVAVRNLPANQELMHKLTTDPSAFVREGLAANRNIPFSIVKVLAADPSKNVRTRICLNRMVPGALISDIMERKNSMRWTSVSNTQPRATNASIASAPQATPAPSSDPVKTPVRYMSAREAMLSEAKSGSDLGFLEQWAVEGSWTIRVAIARNPNTTPEILARMPRHHVDARIALAENPKTPLSVLKTFTKDASRVVREETFMNPNFTNELRRTMAKDASPVITEGIIEGFSDIPNELWDHWASAHSVETRVIVAVCPTAPLHVVERLAASSNRDIRLAAEVGLMRRAAQPVAA